MRTRACAACALLLLAACGGDDRPPLPSASPEVQPPVATADSSWPAIGAPSEERLRVVPFPASPGVRFVIFGASWCPGCVAATLEDAALARRFAGRMEVGIALHGDSDDSFIASSPARWLSGVTVWSAESAGPVAERCGVRMIPYACLVDGERVLWRGSAGDGAVIIDAHLAGTLEATLARVASSDAIVDEAIARGDEASRQRAAAALRGFAGAENSIAWGLVDRSAPAPAELALALELARDATDATSGLNAAILDTYAVALSKSGRAAEAARVGRRVIAVCDAIGSRCGEERARAEELIRAESGA